MYCQDKYMEMPSFVWDIRLCLQNAVQVTVDPICKLLEQPVDV